VRPPGEFKARNHQWTNGIGWAKWDYSQQLPQNSLIQVESLNNENFVAFITRGLNNVQRLHMAYYFCICVLNPQAPLVVNFRDFILVGAPETRVHDQVVYPSIFSWRENIGRLGRHFSAES